MNHIKLKLALPVIAGSLLLAACGNQQGAAPLSPSPSDPAINRAMGTNTDGTTHAHSLRDTGVIPSYYGPKTQTTNEYGNTVSGMGMSVYSMIGSSSLHEGGISSHIESRLRGQGIEGVKVLVLDDTVLLAREAPQITSNQYDELQQKVLSPYAGMSGRGTSTEGALGTRGKEDDNLQKAEEQVKAMFDGNVQIMTVSDPQAVQAIERIKSGLRSAPASDTLTSDLAALMKMAVKK
jgi:hypothetical protein